MAEDTAQTNLQRHNNRDIANSTEHFRSGGVAHSQGQDLHVYTFAAADFRFEWDTDPNVTTGICRLCPVHAATEWDIDASKADSKTGQLTFHHLISCLVGGCQVAVKHYQDSENNCCYRQAHARPQQNKGPQSRVVPTLCLQHSLHC